MPEEKPNYEDILNAKWQIYNLTNDIIATIRSAGVSFHNDKFVESYHSLNMALKKLKEMLSIVTKFSNLESLTQQKTAKDKKNNNKEKQDSTPKPQPKKKIKDSGLHTSDKASTGNNSKEHEKQ